METFKEYEQEAIKTAIYNHEYYPFASLMIEAAEFADLVTKPLLRGDQKEVKRQELVSEGGDVLWNLAMALRQKGITLEEVATYNIDSLRSRKERGVIMGDGGNR